MLFQNQILGIFQNETQNIYERMQNKTLALWVVFAWSHQLVVVYA
jgi:hypothetical protein